MQKWQGAKLCKSGPVSDAIGDKAVILQNHGEIKEQQSLTLTGTRCCFLCSGVFGCLARPDVSPLPLLSCCCVLCKSKVRPPGPAAHPLPPARPHSFGPPHFPKNGDFPEENFSRPEVFQSCTLGVPALITAQFGDLCLREISRRQEASE